MKNGIKQHCPKCGGALPAEAPEGLCPKCLLQQISMPTEGGPETKNPPPTREELAHAFPNLEILELIGRGGMGFVYKARQPKLDRIVALKILPQSLAADPAFTERFTREGRVLARLNHPNIVTVHDFGQANGFFYLLMEFVEGVNLRQAMRAGRFTPAEALSLVPHICEALQYAHNEGILHRDIKPENILLDTRGRVKIADFGIAKLVGEARGEGFVTESGATLGTPHYMAPEQIERPAEVDHRADIYSLGVVIYELLTGELPLGRFPPPSQKTPVSAGVDAVVLRALEKERERRYQSASEVKTQVEGLAGHEEATRKIATTPPQAPARFKAAGVLFLLLGGFYTLVPLLSSWGTHTHTFNVLAFMLFTGVALLTRNRIWRDVALACNAVTLLILLGMLGSYEVDLLGRQFGIPIDPFRPAWSQRPLSLLPLIPLAAGIWLLWHRRTHFHGSSWRERPLFGLLAALCPVLLMACSGLLWRATSTPMAAGFAGTNRYPPRQVRSGPAKVIELTDVTNQFHGVHAITHSPMSPDEVIRPLLEHVDGRIEEAQSNSFYQKAPRGLATSLYLTWVLPAKIPDHSIDRACKEVERAYAHRPLALQSGVRQKIFSVTNDSGGMIHGWLEYEREAPVDPAHARGTARILSVHPVMNGFWVTLDVKRPPGYIVLATDHDMSDYPFVPRTSAFRSEQRVSHEVTFTLPKPFAYEDVPNVVNQIKAIRTPLELAVARPAKLFSVTNGTAVYEGFLELLGSSELKQ
jgi:tRNA A-37 threonylcarbamoyl transferase component Bud32